ncbi:Tat pathway signal protein [Roseomonas xinghualingensis]|uniref:Tat pathway signal protein n=1 Tax=Roseomonas xinghualingensis TaxID=2986475 RepID=UPI0021F13722|nr:Tat pathway signal protein [Roseomonas sp. SXEYE001]MCV4208471.1 Tat pathway signal protein [Roseomonas sp. SXEYE001]
MPLARPIRLLPIFLIAAGLFQAPALAQDQQAAEEAAPRVSVELNRLESRNEGCRVWMRVGNPGPAVDPLRLDLVVFGKDSVVNRRLALDLGPLPAEKTMVRIFDLAGTPCDGLGYILLNDVLACGPDAPPACLARLSVSSRAQGVALEK